MCVYPPYTLFSLIFSYTSRGGPPLLAPPTGTQGGVGSGGGYAASHDHYSNVGGGGGGGEDQYYNNYSENSEQFSPLSPSLACGIGMQTRQKAGVR